MNTATLQTNELTNDVQQQ